MKRWTTSAPVLDDVIVLGVGHLDDRYHQGECHTMKRAIGINEVAAFHLGEAIGRERLHGETDVRLHIVFILLEGKEDGGTPIQPTGETVTMRTGIKNVETEIL